MVDSLEKTFHKSITRFILPDESDEEISIEYAAIQDRKKPRLSQSKPSAENLVPRQMTPTPLPASQKVFNFIKNEFTHWSKSTFLQI